jgi:hypothetical protein
MGFSVRPPASNPESEPESEPKSEPESKPESEPESEPASYSYKAKPELLYRLQYTYCNSDCSEI